MKQLLLAIAIFISACQYGSAQSVATSSEQQNKISDPGAIKLLMAGQDEGYET